MEVQSDLSCHMTLRHVIIHQVKSHGNTGCGKFNSSELIVPGKLHRVKVHIFVAGAEGEGGMVLLALAVLLATAD